MSRTYYEFLKAQDKWRIEHDLKVGSFPYPQRNSIVYLRESNNDFWERRREVAQEQLPFSTLQFTVEDTFNFIGGVANQEEQKEIEFLNQFFPKGEGGANDTLTDKFNILFQSRERYERLLERINAAGNRAKNGWKGMAPNMDTLYGSYLNQTLSEVIPKFRASFSIETDFSVLKEKFNQLVNDAIIEATNRIAAITDENEIYGSGKDWQEIAQMLNNDPYLREQFIINMRNAIGSENIDNVLKQMYDQKSSGKKEKISTILRKNLKLNSRTAAIGGNVIENTSAALAKYLSQVRGGNGNITYAMSGVAVSGQMALTDTVMLFSAEADINVGDLTRQLNETLSGNNKDLEGAQRKLEEFYRDQKEKMDQLYTVFINSKNYQLGGSHGTYEQHKSGSLDELESFLESAGVHINMTDDFLLTLYNTAKNAVYSGQKDQIDESLVSALKAAAVKFMFDDWQMIGSGNGNGIHMFLLSGKYVPSSVIFRAMAQAGENAVSAKANIIVPDIKDPGAQGWGGDNDVEIKEEILKYWNKEYERISSNVRWTADFVINVKRAIGLG